MTTATLLHMLTSLGQNPWVRGTLLIPILLVVLDLATGIGSALKRNVFSWKAFPTFIDTNLLRYLFGLLVIAGINLVSGQEMAAMFAGFFGMAPITASLLVSIRENINELLPPKEAVLANQIMAGFEPAPETFLLDQPATVATPAQPGMITTSFGGGSPLSATPTLVTPVISVGGPFATPGQG